MKGKVLTSWGLVWLLASVFFIAGAALNLSQRAYKDLPPTDGVEWVLRDDGIFAENVRQGYAASRAGIINGDKLIGIGLTSEEIQEVTSTGDIPVYLETAGVGGSLTYFFQRPSYSFDSSFFNADLKNLDTNPRWTPTIILMTC